MKKLILITMIAFWGVNCTSNQGANTEERKAEYAEFVDEPTEITFDNKQHNFGKVVDGEEVLHTFKFTNTGDKNLVLLM